MKKSLAEHTARMGETVRVMGKRLVECVIVEGVTNTQPGGVYKGPVGGFVASPDAGRISSVASIGASMIDPEQDPELVELISGCRRALDKTSRENIQRFIDQNGGALIAAQPPPKVDLSNTVSPDGAREISREIASSTAKEIASSTFNSEISKYFSNESSIKKELERLLVQAKEVSEEFKKLPKDAKELQAKQLRHADSDPTGELGSGADASILGKNSTGERKYMSEFGTGLSKPFSGDSSELEKIQGALEGLAKAVEKLQKSSLTAPLEKSILGGLKQPEGGVTGATQKDVERVDRKLAETIELIEKKFEEMSSQVSGSALVSGESGAASVATGPGGSVSPSQISDIQKKIEDSIDKSLTVKVEKNVEKFLEAANLGAEVEEEVKKQIAA